MPTYDCTKCNRKLSLVTSITQHDQRRTKCPKRGSGRPAHKS